MSDYSHDHDEMDECVLALHQVHAFLHGELGEIDADTIRHHLHACERCMEQFEIETAIEAMIRRAAIRQAAPVSLRMRIRTMQITRHTGGNL